MFSSSRKNGIHIHVNLPSNYLTTQEKTDLQKYIQEYIKVNGQETVTLSGVTPDMIVEQDISQEAPTDPAADSLIPETTPLVEESTPVTVTGDNTPIEDGNTEG